MCKAPTLTLNGLRLLRFCDSVVLTLLTFKSVNDPYSIWTDPLFNCYKVKKQIIMFLTQITFTKWLAKPFHTQFHLIQVIPVRTVANVKI